MTKKQLDGLRIGTDIPAENIFLYEGEQIAEGYSCVIGANRNITSLVITAMFEFMSDNADDMGICEIESKKYGVMKFERKLEEREDECDT